MSSVVEFSVRLYKLDLNILFFILLVQARLVKKISQMEFHSGELDEIREELSISSCFF